MLGYFNHSQDIQRALELARWKKPVWAQENLEYIDNGSEKEAWRFLFYMLMPSESTNQSRGTVIVNFIYQLHWAKGCSHSCLNIISGYVCEAVSRRDYHLNCWVKQRALSHVGGHHAVLWGPDLNKKTETHWICSLPNWLISDINLWSSAILVLKFLGMHSLALNYVSQVCLRAETWLSWSHTFPMGDCIRWLIKVKR